MSASIERATEHRPWPLPRAPWIMFQSWRELLFAHWPVPSEALRSRVPPQLVLEEFDGTAWLGLTPFRLTDLRLRFLPSLPGLSEFPEMNLRTYVRVGARPGIYFFSLDAASALAVLGARAGYRLPYFTADMSIESRDGWLHYRSRRKDASGAEFRGRYRSGGPIFQATRGSLEYFLTERYALYTVLRTGRILRGEIHHPPWPLQTAEAEIECNTVPDSFGIKVSEQPRLLHYSRCQDTLIWPPMTVA